MQFFLSILLLGKDVLGLEQPKSHIRKNFRGLGSEVKTIHGRKAVENKEYTSDEDFDLGTSVNVNHDLPNQLQLDSKATPFNFIWIPISNLGLVVKVDTNTGSILGTYRTSPESHGWGDPSRTTVDSDGSVWVANRNNIYEGQGSIVHIGLLENNQCEDRDGIPGIHTSSSDIPLDWTDATGSRGIDTAQDECIVHYTKVRSLGTRHLSVDANNDVWVSGLENRVWDLVKGGRYDTALSGTILRSEGGWPSYGGYGGLMDSKGIIWSSRNLLRWDPGTTPGTLLNTYSHDSYGLCIDSMGNVWNTALDGNEIRKFDPDGNLIGTYQHGYSNAQGCVVDKNDDVWVAHSLIGNSVGHLKNDGTWIATIPVDSGPTGVAVDGNGKIWASNINSGTLSRINPDTDTVDMTVVLPPGSQPYNYGDMTGSTLIAPPDTGTWNTKYTGVWKRLEWTSDEPSDSSLVVQARDSATGEWVAAGNGVDLPLNSTKEYLEVQVLFNRASTGESPILFDLRIISNSPPNCEHATADPDIILASKKEMVPIAISDVTDPDGDVLRIEITSIFQDEQRNCVESKSGKSTTKSSKSQTCTLQQDGAGIGNSTAAVRADRLDSKQGGNGRVYHISFVAEDENGGSCNGTVRVCVPLDEDEECVDDGPFFDSTRSIFV